MICSDYFTFNCKEYVVIVDRYSNWPMVHRSESGAEGFVKRLRETFVTFGIPEELTSDGRPQYTSGKTQAFLKPGEFDTELHPSKTHMPTVGLS